MAHSLCCCGNLPEAPLVLQGEAGNRLTVALSMSGGCSQTSGGFVASSEEGTMELFSWARDSIAPM